MRTPAQAARDAVEGRDETLWQACWNKLNVLERNQYKQARGEDTQVLMEQGIRSMTSAERFLYDISEE